MAGIYIHVPYCRSKCSYCDFCSSPQPAPPSAYVEGVVREMELRRAFIPRAAVDTLYFGGGTPSLLPAQALRILLAAIGAHFQLSAAPEITLEANPDDLTEPYLRELLDAGVNRLSVGVQSFSPQELQFLGRRHTADQAQRAVWAAHRAGFRSIGIDLMYGLPGALPGAWRHTLAAAFALPIDHLSAYHLTLEGDTPMQRLMEGGQLTAVPEERSAMEFRELRRAALRHGFDQYEVSNFSEPGRHSRHNTAYWTGQPYLGLGPSAHSYSGTRREWSPRAMEQWLALLESPAPALEGEELSPTDRFNEYLLTSLRTKWGIGLDHIQAVFGEAQRQWVEARARRFVAAGLMERRGARLAIRPEQLFASDGVIADLMLAPTP